jgi:hypothetical protein
MGAGKHDWVSFTVFGDGKALSLGGFHIKGVFE